MVGKVDYSSVPTSADLENNSNQKKYTVNQGGKKGLVISKPLCALMVIGALLMAILVGLLVFFLIPRYCNVERLPEALTHGSQNSQGLSINSTNNNINGKANQSPDSIKKTTIFDGASGQSPNGKTTNITEVDERLPRSIEPSHYRIRLLPNLENSTTEGSVRMILKAVQETNKIFFHLRDISIDEHSVNVRSLPSDASPLEITEQQYIEGDKYMIITKANLIKDQDYELNLNYTGKLNGHLKGFYRSKYYRRGKERLIASTQFSPVDARSAFPCFDEPSFKAKFQITLGRPYNMTTLSNMPLFNTTTFKTSTGLWNWDEYPDTPQMSTYLVAFMVSDLKQSSEQDTLMRFWSRADLISHTNYAAQVGPKILSFYENYFDIKFPLPKIDIVALPEFGYSAMENWGLITFREDILLYDPLSSTNENKRSTASVLAHEIAHQWFGNLVTPMFWNDLWLKEGFANYLLYLGVDFAEPKWKFPEEFQQSETMAAMAQDAFTSSRPISFDEVKNSNQIRQLFDPISYQKGAAIIKMMHHFLGEKSFKAGLINFLKNHQFRNADRKDLFAALTEEAHKEKVLQPDENIKMIMDTWTERAGYPVINAFANYEENKIRLFQKRFYYYQKDEKSFWWVPLSFTTSDKVNFTDTTPKFWLKGEFEIEKNVNLSNSNWYLLNLHQTGYFIVNYDERNWINLSDNIMKLPPSIRAQLITDSMDLARANLISYDIPLKIIARMAVRDRDIMFVPTSVAFEKLRYLSDILASTPAFGLFEEYHRIIFRETYRKVTLEDTVDDYITRRIRSTVLAWSCRSSDSRCAHLSRTTFRSWMVNGQRVEPNLRSITYCTAIREGGELEWDFAYKKYLETESPSEKNILLDALGCTKLTWLLSRYLDKILTDSSIRIQDADRLFQSVASNKVGTQIAFDFLRKNWAALIKHHGDGFNVIAKMVKSLGPQLNTEFQLSELIRFRDSIKENISTTAGAFDTAIETAKGNVEWMEKNYYQVEEWLQKYKDRFDYV